MKALYLDELCGNPERPQQNGSQTVMGSKVFEWNLLYALLEHGTYDVYFAPGVTEQVKNDLALDGLTEDSIGRLTPVPLGGPLPATDTDQLVFLTAGRHLDLLATLRGRMRRYDAPVSGFIHSINSPRIALALLQQCFVGLTKADILFCSSRAGMKTINGYLDEIASFLPGIEYSARRIVVPLGVRVPSVQPEARSLLQQKSKAEIKKEDCVALYLGRLSQTSKCDLGPLLVAFSQLRARGTKLRLVIAGDDTQTKEATRLSALAGELCCLESTTIWPDPSSDEKHLLYSAADIFVSPSDNTQETFGLTVAEAMAYGLPAVVSDWDGYRDLVKDGENGFLIPSVFSSNIETLRLCDSSISMLQEDLLAQSTVIDVGVLSRRLEKLASDPSLRVSMGLAARRYVESNCTWRAVVRQYEDLWEESWKLARAAVANGETSPNLLSLSLEKCFGHYATAKVDKKSRCFITTEGREWLGRSCRLYFLCQLSAVPNPRQFYKVLRRISDTPGLSVMELVERLGAYHPSRMEETEWVVARLFKYGLISNQPKELAASVTNGSVLRE